MIWQPIELLFRASMRCIMPARRAGLLGTPEDPVYFESGDTVPWWIEARWPLHATFEFLEDAETYFDGEHQVVRPLWRHCDSLMEIDAFGWSCIVVGAPTLIHGDPRPRRPRPVKSFGLLEAPA